MNSEQKQMRSFKVKNNKGEVRRFRIPAASDEQYAALSEIVMSLFDTNSSPFKLCYTDDEGDRIIIESDCELDAALALMPNLVLLNLVTCEEEQEQARRGRRCGTGRRGNGGGAFGRGNGCGGAFRRSGGCNRGNMGRGPLWSNKIKERLSVVDSKINATEARLCGGEESVVLLWKKENLECEKSFLVDRLKVLEEGEEEDQGKDDDEGNGQQQMKMFMRGGFEGRYGMVCNKIQILEKYVETEEGSQHEGLLSKKQKFEKQKAHMEEKRRSMEEKRRCAEERRKSVAEKRRCMVEKRKSVAEKRALSMKGKRQSVDMEEERRDGPPCHSWLKRVEAQLEKMKEKESRDGFEPRAGFFWKQQQLEQKKLVLQAMLREDLNSA